MIRDKTCQPQAEPYVNKPCAEHGRCPDADHGAGGPDMTNPIELWYWPTPNGWKVSIALEEMGLPYELKPVNIGRGEQFDRRSGRS